MLKWLRDWFSPEKSESEEEPRPMACPSCNEWASKEILDRAISADATTELTCDKCQASRERAYWLLSGQNKAILEALQKRVDASVER